MPEAQKPFPNMGGPMKPEQRLAVKQKFLEGMARSNIITASCEAAGVSRVTKDAWIAEGFLTQGELDDAFQKYQDMLRGEIARMGLVGVPTPMVLNGRVVTDDVGNQVMVYKRSERVLLKMAERMLPEFREDNKTLVIQQGDGIPEEYRLLIDLREATDEEFGELLRIAKQMHERKTQLAITGAA